MDTDREIPFVFQGDTHTAWITTYKDGTGNSAIQTFDDEGLPYCRLSTNPEIPLERSVIALRDDYELVIGETRDALLAAEIIEKLEPTQQVRIGLHNGHPVSDHWLRGSRAGDRSVLFFFFRARSPTARPI